MVRVSLPAARSVPRRSAYRNRPAGAGGPDPLDQRPLGHQFEFDFALDDSAPGKPDARGDGKDAVSLRTRPSMIRPPKAKSPKPAPLWIDDQIGRPLLPQRFDQHGQEPPDSPKPPNMMVAPSNTGATASLQLATVLSITCYLPRRKSHMSLRYASANTLQHYDGAIVGGPATTDAEIVGFHFASTFCSGPIALTGPSGCAGVPGWPPVPQRYC